MTEHPLGGGNVAAGVVRVGDTVRKPAGFWTPAVDALLTHVRRAGFAGAPRPLGRGARGPRAEASGVLDASRRCAAHACAASRVRRGAAAAGPGRPGPAGARVR